MNLQVGFELLYECPQPVPMILLVNVHFSRSADMVLPDLLTTQPAIPFTAYRDGFGNLCHVIRAPAGRLTMASDFLVRDSDTATGKRSFESPYARGANQEEDAEKSHPLFGVGDLPGKIEALRRGETFERYFAEDVGVHEKNRSLAIAAR